MLKKLKAFIQGKPASAADANDGGSRSRPGQLAGMQPSPTKSIPWSRSTRNHPLDPLRFGPEGRLLDDLRQRFALDQLVDHIFDAGEIAPLHQVFLAQQVRLTPLMAPRLFRIFESVRESLRFEEEVHLYVRASEPINAHALFRLQDDEPHAISVTSGAVKSMSDAELSFALGHELGHLHFRHARVSAVHVAFGGDDDENPKAPKIPPLLERRLDAWGRLCEISADRVGFRAAGNDMSTAVSCFFKMASGLGPEHLNFDMSAFLDQLNTLAAMERREVMAKFSHPITPVRARALQLYAEREASTAVGPLDDVDADISKLTALMDFEVSTEIGVQAREFLLAAGLLAAHADGEMSEEEHSVVVQLLLQVTGDPEEHLTRIKSIDDAEAMLERACTWLSANAGQERFSLFGQVAHIVAVDGKLTDRERSFMLGLASRLGIPERSAREVLHEILSRYVRTKTSMGSGAGGRAGWGFASD